VRRAAPVRHTAALVADQGSDPTVLGYRDRIDAVDGRIVDALNERIALVRELHAYKAQQGYATTDPGREEAMVLALQERNGGPLTDDGVRDLVVAVLRLTRQEVGRRHDDER
jgi:chorismate mutase